MADRRRYRRDGTRGGRSAHYLLAAGYLAVVVLAFLAVFGAGLLLVHGGHPAQLGVSEYLLVAGLVVLFTILAIVQFRAVRIAASLSLSPIRRIEHFFAELSNGTTTQRLAFRETDGLDELARDLNRVAESHHKELSLVQTRLPAVLQRLSAATATESDGDASSAQRGDLDELERVLVEIERHAVSEPS